VLCLKNRAREVPNGDPLVSVLKTELGEVVAGLRKRCAEQVPWNATVVVTDTMHLLWRQPVTERGIEVPLYSPFTAERVERLSLLASKVLARTEKP
jgi:hypothetical protein